MNKTTEILSRMDCYLLAMELVCRSMKKNFIYMFVNSRRFQYNYFDKSLVVINSYEDYMKQINFEYLGITAHEIPKQDTNFNALKGYLDTYKVLVLSTDSFYCPWHRGYSQISIWHCCVLVGYDKEGIWCVDPYLKGNEPFLLPNCTLEQSTVYYYTDSDNVKNINIEILFDRIVADEAILKETIKMIEAYKRDICFIETASDLFDYPQDIYLCKITRGLKSISDGRFQLGYLLEYLYEQQMREDKRIQHIYNLLYDVSNTWQNVHNIIIRLFFDTTRLEKTKDKFETYISKIIETEKRILLEIKSYLSQSVSELSWE